MSGTVIFGGILLFCVYYDNLILADMGVFAIVMIGGVFNVVAQSAMMKGFQIQKSGRAAMIANVEIVYSFLIDFFVF